MSNLNSQSCQIGGTAQIGTWWQPTSGYTCAGCGVFVPHGIWHNCPRWQTFTHPSAWSFPVPQITTFKGAVKALKDLPKSGTTGDAYYVTTEDILVVRQNGGWFHFDKK